jgi:hypothetical protein
MQVKTWLFAAVSVGTLLFGSSNQDEVRPAIGSRDAVVWLDRTAPPLVAAKRPAGPIQQWGKDARFMALLPELQELSAR